MVAHRDPDRLFEIDLYVANSMTGLIIETIQKPCQALESIWIEAKEVKGPSIVVRNGFWVVLFHT
jgi:hypothetical protein